MEGQLCTATLRCAFDSSCSSSDLKGLLKLNLCIALVHMYIRGRSITAIASLWLTTRLALKGLMTSVVRQCQCATNGNVQTGDILSTETRYGRRIFPFPLSKGDPPCVWGGACLLLCFCVRACVRACVGTVEGAWPYEQN